jgi:hypothetical protein
MPNLDSCVKIKFNIKNEQIALIFRISIASN